MKNRFYLGLLACLMGLFPFLGFSQDCVDFHKTNCKPPESTSSYSYDPASRSGLLMKGQTSEFRVDLYQGRDYRITICNQEALGNNVQYRIIDNEDNSVLYDNKEFNFEKAFEFSVLISRQVKIVVTVPADDKTSKTTSIGLKPKPTQMGCVGVLVESMVTPKKGF